MRISIITATYNSAATVRDTLDSIAKQDYADIEHIIIDGCSRDNTLQIVKEFPHVSKIISEKDAGIYDAMNKGLKIATGDLIAILNSDDVYNSDTVISEVVSEFSSSGNDAVYGDLVYVKADNLDKVTRYWKSGRFSLKKFYYGWMPPHPAFFLTKEAYDKIGTFHLQFRSAADYEFMLRALVKYKLKASYIPKTLVRMREGGLSNASLKNRLRANREDRMAWTINNLKPYFFTLYLKPLRKIFQFIIK